MLHLVLHFAIPALLVGIFLRPQWRHAYLLLIASMLIDSDHLLANPIYDPNRCSIGFHPLHQPWFALLYLALSCVPKTRLLGIGLSLHIILDAIDCQITNGVWIAG